MAAFTGFSSQAVEFYRDLEDDNSKAFWTAHKPIYDREIREPMLALLDDVADEFGTGKAFRPYRDTRFSADKTPYKSHQGAFIGRDMGIGYYVQIGPAGLLVGGGFRMHSSDQVEQFRAAIDDDTSGPELERLVAGLREEGFAIEGARLKTKPRGYDADHPRIDLLRFKELMVLKTYGTPRWLGTPAALDEIVDTWRAIRPLTTWVADHVSPA